MVHSGQIVWDQCCPLSPASTCLAASLQISNENFCERLDSNPGGLSETRECYLCAVPSLERKMTIKRKLEQTSDCPRGRMVDAECRQGKLKEVKTKCISVTVNPKRVVTDLYLMMHVAKVNIIFFVVPACH